MSTHRAEGEPHQGFSREEATETPAGEIRSTILWEIASRCGQVPDLHPRLLEGIEVAARKITANHVPMPSGYSLAATVREPDDDLVARVAFKDVLGDQRMIDLKPSLALSLAGDLIAFVRQVGL